MNLLALREHSKKELVKKLLQKHDDAELIAQVVAELAARDLQSDERFAEEFVKMRCRQGKGPVRIAYDLQERGIIAEVAHALIAESGYDWIALAEDVRAKRFAEKSPESHQEKAKQMRFLQYRGFTMEQIRAVVS